MRVGLFFGSFNPIHIGHLITAESFRVHSNLDEVWFVISPHNPLKNKNELASEYYRKTMVLQSIVDNIFFKCSDIEFKMEKPSYTANTLKKIRKENENKDEFVILMGMDCINNILQWKDYKYILEQFEINIANRGIEKLESSLLKYNIKEFNINNLSISSTLIRKMIKNKSSIKYLVHKNVEKYILKNKIYE
jgi:nicotinate-nucleotide adenylyltransferase